MTGAFTAAVVIVGAVDFIALDKKSEFQVSLLMKVICARETWRSARIRVQVYDL